LSSFPSKSIEERIKGTNSLLFDNEPEAKPGLLPEAVCLMPLDPNLCLIYSAKSCMSILID